MRATKTLNRNRVLALAASTVGLVGLLAGPVLAATITGTSGDDELVGTPKADTIRGYAGKDTVWGRLGGDTINPGSGNDVVRGGRGNDWVEVAGPGADRAFGGRGSDVAEAGLGDAAFLGVGDDWGYVLGKGAVVRGGPGADFFFAWAPGRIFGGPGNDIACGPGQDSPDSAVYRYWLGAGNDKAFPGEGLCQAEEWWDGSGRDVVFAGPGSDLLRFQGSGRDRAYAGPGGDRVIVANRQHRLVDCGHGKDVLKLVGGAKPDVIRGCERVARDK